MRTTPAAGARAIRRRRTRAAVNPELATLIDVLAEIAVGDYLSAQDAENVDAPEHFTRPGCQKAGE